MVFYFYLSSGNVTLMISFWEFMFPVNSEKDQSLWKNLLFLFFKRYHASSFFFLFIWINIWPLSRKEAFMEKLFSKLRSFFFPAGNVLKVRAGACNGEGVTAREERRVLIQGEDRGQKFINSRMERHYSCRTSPLVCTWAYSWEWVLFVVGGGGGGGWFPAPNISASTDRRTNSTVPW